MNSSFRFSLDMHSTQSQISIPVTVYDTARVLLISLSDGASPFFIPDGCLALFSCKRPTGTIFESFCAIENNSVIKYDFSQDGDKISVLIPGLYSCSIILYDAERAVIASPRFSLVATERVVTNDDVDYTDDDRTAIDAALSQEAVRVQNEHIRESKEDSRIINECARQSAENGRVEAESGRVEAENAREDAEALREETTDAALIQFNDIMENFKNGNVKKEIIDAIIEALPTWEGGSY